MGLAISVGFQADLKHNDGEGYVWAKEMFAQVNSYLNDEGYHTWEEPDHIEALSMRPHVGSFPYSFIHYLRRAYAHLCERPDVSLAPTERLTDADDALIADAGSMISSHLICHSDCEGVYVPVDFPDPLFDLDSNRVPSTMLGSSYGLMRELREVAPLIGVTLTDKGELSDEEAARMYDIVDSGDFYREQIVFLTLWEAASASIRHKTAIVFT